MPERNGGRRGRAGTPLWKRMLAITEVALLGFLITLLVTLGSSQATQHRIQSIRDGHGPSLVTSRALESTFTGLQRVLQDAVTAAEMDRVLEADSLAQRFRALLHEAGTNPTVDHGDIDSLRQDFDDYYALVRATTVAMIMDADGALELDRLRAVGDGFSALQGRLAERTREDEEAVNEALAAVARFQKRATAANALVLLVFVVGLSVLSLRTWRIIHRTLERVRDTATGIAAGELDRPFRFDETVDVQELTAPFEAIVDYIRDIAGAADRLARGDNSVRIQPRSERDVIARSLGRALEDRDQLAETLRAAEEQARHAQKMEAVGRLAGGIAHDFNNLLTAIGGHATLALERLDGNPAREDIEEIQGAADRAAGLTRQLLAYSRKQVLRPQVSDLNRVVDRTLRMVRPILGEQISLSAHTDSRLWPVVVDPNQIEQALVNLLVNARDAMEDTGTVTIETRNVELGPKYVLRHPSVESGDYVMLAVSDNGPGIPPAIRERVFEPFFTTKPQGKGTGLGLSMVYGLVKQSGGEIWLYSEEGKGTAFKLYFPRARAELPEQASTVEPASGTGLATHGSERVLLVEDDPAVRGVAAKTLRRHGYDVLEAENGRDALRVIVADGGPGIDLVVSDVVMPEMSGWELASELRSRYPDLHILFISGYSEDVVERPESFTIAHNYLEKPFSPGELALKVRQILNASASSPAPA